MYVFNVGDKAHKIVCRPKDHGHYFSSKTVTFQIEDSRSPIL